RLGLLQAPRLRQCGRFPVEVGRPRPDRDEPDAPRHGPARERPEGPRPPGVPPRQELQDEGRGPGGEDPRAGALDDEADRPPARPPPPYRQAEREVGARRRPAGWPGAVSAPLRGWAAGRRPASRRDGGAPYRTACREPRYFTFAVFLFVFAVTVTSR